jgi:H+-transporting ATPase
VLTYTLRSIIHKVVQVLFLAVGLVLTGQAILTPTLMVLMMVTGDGLAMSSATDTVRPSPTPNVWRIGPLTLAGIGLGIVDLMFCILCLATGKFVWGLDTKTLQTLTVITLVFGGQAVFYIARERRHFWSSWPGRWLLLSSAIDLSLVVTLALNGWLMAPLAPAILGGIFLAAMVLAVVLDGMKSVLFRALHIA